MSNLSPPIWRGLLVVLVGVGVGAFIGWLNKRVDEPRPTQGQQTTQVIVCRPRRGWVIFGCLVGIVAVVGGVTLAIYLALGYGEIHGRLFFIFVSLVDVLLGIYFILGALKYRVILEPDAIALLGIFIDKRLHRNEIRAKKYTFNAGGKLVILYPVLSLSGKWTKKITIAFIYDRNADIENWVSSIPTLGEPYRPAR
ncbi:MAG TPA: hypothetical protein VNF04_11330 [Stellaceae bacterium]|nr:hypothetical protein [Stellaceae bacterium]